MCPLTRLSVLYLAARNLVILFLLAFVINISETSAQITPPKSDALQLKAPVKSLYTGLLLPIPELRLVVTTFS
jgi:hypothetical protein